VLTTLGIEILKHTGTITIMGKHSQKLGKISSKLLQNTQIKNTQSETIIQYHLTIIDSQ